MNKWHIVRKNFIMLTPEDVDGMFNDFKIAENPEIDQVVSALKENIYSIISATSFPFLTASRTYNDRTFQRIYTAEKIRHMVTEISPGQYPEEEWDAAQESAIRKFNEHIYSPENQEEIKNDVVGILLFYIRDEKTLAASKELLKQATVSVWGSFEVFINDVTKKYINAHPTLARTILTSQQTKKYFSQNPFNIEALYERSFDVTNSVGDILLSDKRLGSIEMISDIYSVIVKNSDPVFQAISSKTLRKLNQRRHILVHQRGVIDKSYLERTSDTGEIGSHVDITGSDIEEYINIVLHTSKCIVKSLNKTYTQNP